MKWGKYIDIDWNKERESTKFYSDNITVLNLDYKEKGNNKK